MNLPSFNNFLESTNMDTMAYDFEHAIATIAEQSGEAFSSEQLKIITHCSVAASTALLRSYHAWLSEMLESSCG